MMSTRELTKSEVKAVNFIKAFNRYCEQKRLSAVVFMSGTTLEYIQQNKIAVPLKVDFDTGRKLYKVTYLLGEFRRYVEYTAEKVGFRIDLDGTIRTFDNHVINLSVEGNF